MDRRPELQQLLKSLFDKNPHVYHQGPGSRKMEYPCIVYKLTDIPERYADNQAYMEHRTYQLTVIDQDPDSKLREKVAKELKWCRFDRFFVSDNLNHYVFTLHY